MPMVICRWRVWGWRVWMVMCAIGTKYEEAYIVWVLMWGV